MVTFLQYIIACPGNGTAIFTTNGATARKFTTEIDVGQVECWRIVVTSEITLRILRMLMMPLRLTMHGFL